MTSSSLCSIVQAVCLDNPRDRLLPRWCRRKPHCGWSATEVRRTLVQFRSIAIDRHGSSWIVMDCHGHVRWFTFARRKNCFTFTFRMWFGLDCRFTPQVAVFWFLEKQTCWSRLVVSASASVLCHDIFRTIPSWRGLRHVESIAQIHTPLHNPCRNAEVIARQRRLADWSQEVALVRKPHLGAHA